MRKPPGIFQTMNPREKVRLYHELAQLIRSGVPFPKAIEKLANLTRGNARAALVAVSAALSRGASVAESLAAGAPFIGPLEAGMFAASDRAGRVENGLTHASEYYAALTEARGRMWRQSAYPLFVLHLAFVALSIPRLVAPEGGMEAFLKTLGFAVGVFWLGGWVMATLIRVLLAFGATNAGFDRILRTIPYLGGLRTAFALGRFCSAYSLQLDAGVNVLSSLEVAGHASGSALVCESVDRSLEAVRDGGSVGTALAASGNFPESFIRAFSVGEDSGQLDQELRRVGDEYHSKALKRLDSLAEWLPRAVLLAVAIYIGAQVIGFYRGRLQQIEDVMKN